ncbi:MAG: hypothetical protein HGB29_03650 [Chlorobiaceae bacterium]|nr:hypothetical protein [Chlorobiaceae bacterium]NTW73938.1 hypothetical protein [Chlorobiaceae bacterium]
MAVDATEKERMDYQYRLERKKIIIDKLLIGALVAMFAFLGNMVIEHNRELAQTQAFVLQKKLEALNVIRESYASMFDKFDLYTLSVSAIASDGYHKEFRKALDDFILKQSQYSTLLSDKFNRQAEAQSWIFSGLDTVPSADRERYRLFAFDLYDSFYAVSREELGLSGQKGRSCFQLTLWSHEAANRKGSTPYLQENFRRWRDTFAKKNTD